MRRLWALQVRVVVDLSSDSREDETRCSQRGWLVELDGRCEGLLVGYMDMTMLASDVGRGISRQMPKADLSCQPRYRSAVQLHYKDDPESSSQNQGSPKISAADGLSAGSYLKILRIKAFTLRASPSSRSGSASSNRSSIDFCASMSGSSPSPTPPKLQLKSFPSGV